MSKPVVRVDVVSDVVCPWCYIGKTRLDKAINSLHDQYTFEVYYHPFELNPSIPSQGIDQKKYLTDKFGGAERYEQITAHVTRIAAEEGLVFDFARQHVSPNTLDAHRIVWLAGTQGIQQAVVAAFYRAYFEQGVDLSQTENLVRVATTAGLDEQRVRALLASEEGKQEVRAAQQQAHNLRITSVPFFIINQQYGVSGAQPTETFISAIEEAVVSSAGK